MSTASGSNGSRHSAAVEQLREQIAQDRRDLAQTVTALHDKVDVKTPVREKAVDAQLAAADLTAWAGRMAGAVPHLAKQAAVAASQQVQRVPQPVRTQVEQAAGLARRQLRAVTAVAVTILVLAVVNRRRLSRRF